MKSEIIQNKTLKNNQNRHTPNIKTDNSLVYANGYFFKNGTPYSMEEALEKFKGEAERILKRESWEWALKLRK